MTTLEQMVAAELARPAPSAARAIADEILREHGASVAAILFYGSRRRDDRSGGLLDLYVLFDRHLAFHRSPVPALFNRLLPPNVMFVRASDAGGSVAAKVAVMSRRSFARRMGAATLDTTIWTRFCQPSTLVYARDPHTADWVAATVATGLRTAASWARRSAPPGAGSAECWRALFARTYRLEIRPEAGGRSDLVYQASADWFDQVATITNAEPAAEIGRRSWRARKLVGKPLNVMRLVKAAFTFQGGADYLTDKLSRHTGVHVEPTPWQRRHPLLGAPVLLIDHRRKRESATTSGERASGTD